MAPVRPKQQGTAKEENGSKNAACLQARDNGVKKAEHGKADTLKKRSAFVDLTNAIEKSILGGKKNLKGVGKVKKGRNERTTAKAQAKRAEPKGKGQSKQKKDAENDEEGGLSLECIYDVPSSQSVTSSQEVKSDLSSYDTAPEDTSTPDIVRQLNEKNTALSSVEEDDEDSLPPGVVDFDKETATDIFAVSAYAVDIFNYFKTREEAFRIPRYLDGETDLSPAMRAILVDWMVEVQESFELNHETLYLAVKLVDLFLAKVPVTKDCLQLVGATAIFIAAKYDERFPPPLDDFLYICDEAYMRREIIQMEMKMLRVIGFDLGIPLSYRYLRRYARCSRQSMEVLTLARYILETSLMEYDLISASDALLAASALRLALKMKKLPSWSPTLEYFSGFCEEDLVDLTRRLNQMLHKEPAPHINTVRSKYSHQVFFEVAKIAKVSDAEL